MNWSNDHCFSDDLLNLFSYGLQQIKSEWTRVQLRRNLTESCNFFQQLATFSRVWYLFDAKWQCPHLSGERIARILRGEHKPIYYPGGKEPIDNENIVTLPPLGLAKFSNWQLRVLLKGFFVVVGWNVFFNHTREEKNIVQGRW